MTHNKSIRKYKGDSLLSFPSSFTVIDLETTGLSPEYDAIIEVAALKVNAGKIVDTFSSVTGVIGYVYINDFITELTGITQDMVDRAPKINDILPEFLNFIGNDIILGHNVNFDINFLYDNSLKILKIPFTNNFIDTMRISRRLHPENSHHRLVDLCNQYSIDYSNAHRALDDCKITLDCFNALHSDVLSVYGNEEAVGRAIQRAIDEGICTREEIFVTTKMWTDDYDDGDAAIDASLERLGLDYIDLMILHHSQPENDVEAYQAMERAVADGKLRSIGLSNYYEPEDFDRLVDATTIVPALLQNETHLYHQSREMKEHISQYGTVMESWFPLGGRGQTQILFDDPTVVSIAEAHDKTSAQIILRWHLQAGNIAIPGSSNPDHILENLSIFDFSLSDEEMEQLTALDRNERFASY